MTQETSHSRPSTPQSLDLHVLEATDSPAAAFAAALLGDFGASVTVLERVGGSAIRRLGGAEVQAVWWPILARNKRSIALDHKSEASDRVIEAALGKSGIVFTDDSPMGQRVREIAARVEANAVIVRLFNPGADQPQQWSASTQSRFAGLATGAVALTGRPDGPPIQAEFPLADHTTGIMAATLALIELRRARMTGTRPKPIELGLHETLQRMNEWQVVVASVQGHAEPRNGNRFPMNWNLGNIFATRDDRLLTVSAATPSVADRLMNMVGGDALRTDPRFSTPQARRVHMDALDTEIAGWMRQHDAHEAMRQVLENDVVVGPLYDANQLLSDSHVAARGDIVRLSDEQGRSVPMPAVLPHIESMPGAVRHLGPQAGEGGREALQSWGFDDTSIDMLAQQGVFWQAPIALKTGVAQ